MGRDARALQGGRTLTSSKARRGEREPRRRDGGGAQRSRRDRGGDAHGRDARSRGYVVEGVGNTDDNTTYPGRSSSTRIRRTKARRRRSSKAVGEAARSTAATSTPLKPTSSSSSGRTGCPWRDAVVECTRYFGNSSEQEQNMVERPMLQRCSAHPPQPSGGRRRCAARRRFRDGVVTVELQGACKRLPDVPDDAGERRRAHPQERVPGVTSVVRRTWPTVSCCKKLIGASRQARPFFRRKIEEEPDDGEMLEQTRLR